MGNRVTGFLIAVIGILTFMLCIAKVRYYSDEYNVTFTDMKDIAFKELAIEDLEIEAKVPKQKLEITEDDISSLFLSTCYTAGLAILGIIVFCIGDDTKSGNITWNSPDKNHL